MCDCEHEFTKYLTKQKNLKTKLITKNLSSSALGDNIMKFIPLKDEFFSI